MEVSTPQLLGIIGAVLTTGAVFETLRRGIVPERFAALWIIVSGTLLVLAVFPQIGLWLARVTGVSLPANLLFFASSVLLLLVSIQFSYEFGKSDARTRRLAEEVALLRNDIDELRGQHTAPTADDSAEPPA